MMPKKPGVDRLGAVDGHAKMSDSLATASSVEGPPLVEVDVGATASAEGMALDLALRRGGSSSSAARRLVEPLTALFSTPGTRLAAVTV